MRSVMRCVTLVAGACRLLTSAGSPAPGPLPRLHTLAVGIDHGPDAVVAGLTLPRNSDVAEGHINRIKTLEHQMSGRAGFALLHKRVPLTP